MVTESGTATGDQR